MATKPNEHAKWIGNANEAPTGRATDSIFYQELDLKTWPCPEFSTKLINAFEIVDWMAGEGYYLKLQSPFDPNDPYNNSWRAEFIEHSADMRNPQPNTLAFMGSAGTAPLAICRAAIWYIRNRDQN